MTAHLPEHSELTVVGGGPVGATVALLAAQAGRQVTLLEARPSGSGRHDDPRVLALSHTSQQALLAAGAWPDSLPATPIDTVHISQQGSFGRTLIQRDDLQLPHLGYTVGYHDLNVALDQALAQSSVQRVDAATVTGLSSLSAYARVQFQHDGQRHALTTRLVVLAEGGALAAGLPGMRRHEHDYQQSAVIARVETALPHQGMAFERFATDGPLALLPYGNALMLVWTRDSATAESLKTLDDTAFCTALQGAIGDRLGAITAVSPRATVPLKLKFALNTVSGRVALVGNAAQTMHPVAAQGLNLGLRDALGLVQALGEGGDVGDARKLAEFARLRRIDRRSVTGFTHSLIQLFDRHDPVINTVRGLSLSLLDSIGPLRRAFAGHLVFGVGV